MWLSLMEAGTIAPLVLLAYRVLRNPTISSKPYTQRGTVHRYSVLRVNNKGLPPKDAQWLPFAHSETENKIFLKIPYNDAGL